MNDEKNKKFTSRTQTIIVEPDEAFEFETDGVVKLEILRGLND